MRVFLTCTVLCTVRVLTFPFVLSPSNGGASERDGEAESLERRIGIPKGPNIPIPSSNCGPLPCLTFSEKGQYVDVRPGSAHQYIKPGAGDIRGPCPGLNAAANHGYLARTGLPSIAQTVTGLGEAFGVGADLAGFLGAFAVALSGDPETEIWSIGGPFPGTFLNGAGGEPQGITYSHNKYEGDASPCRDDAYSNGGDAHSLIMEKFEHMYNLAESYTTETMYEQFRYNIHRSITKNPYYFSAPFSGLLAAPVAHYFITNLMSNHSEEHKGGYLDRDMLKTFFGVKGEPGSLKWLKGQEQIPQNWYRRPLTNPYTTMAAGLDIQLGYVKHPYLLRIGGNMGKTNTFTGVSISDLTGGVYNSDNLFKNNYAACLAFQSIQIGLTDWVKNVVGKISPALDLVNKHLEPVLGSLSCPKLQKYNQGLFNKFPGYHYNPHGKDQSY